MRPVFFSRFGTFFILSLLVLNTQLHAGSKHPAPKGNYQSTQEALLLKFKESTFDFGKVKCGDTVYHDYEFTNVSKQPVVISEVQVSCRCTKPTYPLSPIMPGKTAKVRLGFTAPPHGNSLPFKRQSMVKLNGSSQSYSLEFSGTLNE